MSSCPAQACQSLRHIPVAITCTSTPSSGTFGTATERTSGRAWAASNTTARIAPLFRTGFPEAPARTGFGIRPAHRPVSTSYTSLRSPDPDVRRSGSLARQTGITPVQSRFFTTAPRNHRAHTGTAEHDATRDPRGSFTGIASLGWGVLLSRRSIVAVSAARLKVVAVGASPAWALHLDPLRCDGGLAAIGKGCLYVFRQAHYAARSIASVRDW
ncbi:hypothetical protein GCM10028793_19120 [Nocardiopsis oceani]